MQEQKIPDTTVLVIDDIPTNLLVLSEFLTGVGYKVLVKKDGQSGLKLAYKKQIDLVLLDVMMPEMDGYETCKRLKSNAATKDIPVIFMSALTDTVNKVKGFNSGGVDYITKPFQMQEVLVRIETHIKLQRMQKTLEMQNIQLQNEIMERKRTEEDLLQAKKELEMANKQLSNLANLDGLTQIANRRKFDEYLFQEWHRYIREENWLSLILCDIDHFKLYNDTYGHLAGDDCLQKVAKAMSQATKRATDLVTRYGGEEFAIILPNTNLQGAVKIAENVQKAIHDLQVAHSESKAKFVTLSLGVTSAVPNQKMKIQKFILAADVALYNAKKEGRNCIMQNLPEQDT